jgi:hypothetical protein
MEYTTRYFDILPEIEEVCLNHHDCYQCPYSDVCLADYGYSNEEENAFQAAIVKRYKELKEKKDDYFC